MNRAENRCGGRMSFIAALLFACATIGWSLVCCATGSADVVVYKKSCGHNAFEDWNLTCKIDKNTFQNTDAGKDFWADPFRDLQSITICASFDNHGGFGVATVVHTSKDGQQSLPTELFDTVKFRGGLMGEKLSWVGTSPRLVPIWSPAWRMQAELAHDGKQDLFAYAEILSNGQRPVGEIRATCRNLEDE